MAWTRHPGSPGRLQIAPLPTDAERVMIVGAYLAHGGLSKSCHCCADARGIMDRSTRGSDSCTTTESDPNATNLRREDPPIRYREPPS